MDIKNTTIEGLVQQVSDLIQQLEKSKNEMFDKISEKNQEICQLKLTASQM